MLQKRGHFAQMTEHGVDEAGLSTNSPGSTIHGWQSYSDEKSSTILSTSNFSNDHLLRSDTGEIAMRTPALSLPLETMLAMFSRQL